MPSLTVVRIAGISSQFMGDLLMHYTWSLQQDMRRSVIYQNGWALNISRGSPTTLPFGRIDPSTSEGNALKSGAPCWFIEGVPTVSQSCSAYAQKETYIQRVASSQKDLSHVVLFKMVLQRLSIEAVSLTPYCKKRQSSQ